MAVPQVSALDIQFNQDGQVEFHSGSVLGKNDDRGREDQEDKVEDEAKPQLMRADNKTFNVKSREGKFELELEEEDQDVDRSELRNVERMEVDDIRMEFPAQLRDSDDDESEGYMEKIREERQERDQEMVELKNKIKEKKQTLDLKSRNVRATLKNGAEFQLDSETNQITIVTPSGEEHVLNHLPDQAVTKMTEAGFFSAAGDEIDEDLEVKTNDLGELIYVKKDQIKKKLFGFFPRQIDSEIILNDATGEVTAVELEGESIFERFFNAVSF